MCTTSVSQPLSLSRSVYLFVCHHMVLGQRVHNGWSLTTLYGDWVVIVIVSRPSPRKMYSIDSFSILLLPLLNSTYSCHPYTPERSIATHLIWNSSSELSASHMPSPYGFSYRMFIITFHPIYCSVYRRGVVLAVWDRDERRYANETGSLALLGVSAEIVSDYNSRFVYNLHK